MPAPNESNPKFDDDDDDDDDDDNDEGSVEKETATATAATATATFESKAHHTNNRHNGRSIHLQKLCLYNWKPSTHRSMDENYMDMILLLTRNSHCRQGSMASILVQKSVHANPESAYPTTREHIHSQKTKNEENTIQEETEASFETQIHSSIIGAGINSSFCNSHTFMALPPSSLPPSSPSSLQKKSLFQCNTQTHTHDNTNNEKHNHINTATLNQKNNSDIHAEINALGSAARHGNSTYNACIYITMPPCNKCFGSIVATGIKRIVTCKPCNSKQICQIAKELDIELVHWNVTDQQRTRIERLVRMTQHQQHQKPMESCHMEVEIQERLEIEARRKRKREEKRERKEKALMKWKDRTSF